MPESAPRVFGDGRPASGGGLSVGLVVGGPAAADGSGRHCGVRDYALCLAEALRGAGVDARVMAPQSWRGRQGIGLIRALRRERLDLVHVQYPSIGMRHSLLPHVLGVGRSCVVTLHEHSALPRAQRAASHLFRATTDRLIFTTHYEAAAFGAGAGARVIPIGSNVPVHPPVDARGDTVLYFGQVRPGKGIEAFLELAALGASAGEPWQFIIIGSVPPRWRDYGRALRAQAPPGVVWAEDAPFPAVSEAMATAAAAYLPFPDGAGLRRGSLLAALSNGLPVIAPLGPGTTEALHAALLPAATPGAAQAQLHALRASPALGARLAAAGRALAREFAWPQIADAHVSLYREVLARRARSERALRLPAMPWHAGAGRA